MRAKIVRELERRIQRAFEVKTALFLVNNPFPKTVGVAAWLKDIYYQKLNGTTVFPDFSGVANAPTAVAAEGDHFYQQLFRNGGFTTSHTAPKESLTPYTDVLKTIYRQLFKGDHNNLDGLVIYSELRKTIEIELGRQLAEDSRLQSYEQWIALYKALEVDHTVLGAWLEALPVKSIRREDRKFLTSKKRIHLEDIAVLLLSYHERKEAARDYTRRLQKLPKNPPFAFIQEAIKGADYMNFQWDAALQKHLVKHLGIVEYLHFVDSLRYPIAQQYALGLLDNFEDYILLIEQTCRRNKRKTPKEHLLLMILISYVRFIENTLSELSYLSKPQHTHESTQIQQARKEAADISELWMKQTIPDSFRNVIQLVFPKPELTASPYFSSFFHWLCSYSKRYLTHHNMTSKRELIEVLNVQFQERLNRDTRGYHFLAAELGKGKVPPEGLRILYEALLANPGDTSFRDKLYAVYLTHLKDEGFRWNTDGNVDKGEALNSAYFFSEVLNSFADGYEKWFSLFSNNRIRYEGWMPNPYDFLRQQRESYLLTVGMGIAYANFRAGASLDGNLNFLDVLTLLIVQIRSNDRGLVDYRTPLGFSSQTLGLFQPKGSDWFIETLHHKIDSFELFLEVVYKFLLYSADVHSGVCLEEATKELIENKIASEFFTLDRLKNDEHFKAELGYFTSIKDEILKMIRPVTPSLSSAEEEMPMTEEEEAPL